LTSKNSVLIIEDSPAVGMLLAEFMRKLGYEDMSKLLKLDIQE